VQKHHLMLKNPLDDVFAPYGSFYLSIEHDQLLSQYGILDDQILPAASEV
jgi:hypothetical protein